MEIDGKKGIQERLNYLGKEKKCHSGNTKFFEKNKDISEKAEVR
jgi:hypothetical protein